MYQGFQSRKNVEITVELAGKSVESPILKGKKGANFAVCKGITLYKTIILA